MTSRTRITASVLAAAFLAAGAAWARAPVVVVSYDGFRWDYLYRPAARAFRALAREGTRARRLVPCFPTKTYPNHYSLATGRYPAGHGIVANHMLDPRWGAEFRLQDRAAVEDGRWWEAEPLWLTAQRQGRGAAVYFWPGSEAAIGGVRPDRWRRYDGKVAFSDQVETVLGWLELPGDTRPDLVMLYFREPDTAGHVHGPASPELDAALEELGEVTTGLVRGIRERAPGAHVLMVSDHGMAPVEPGAIVRLDDHVDPAWIRMADTAPVTSIWPVPGREADVRAALRDAHPALTLHPPGALPAAWRYVGHPRIAPVIATVAEGWLVARRGENPRPRGMHGYPPELPSMGGLFLALGPRVHRGRVVRAFPNVEVYSLACELLGIDPAPHDGAGRDLGVLRR